MLRHIGAMEATKHIELIVAREASDDGLESLSKRVSKAFGVERMMAYDLSRTPFLTHLYVELSRPTAWEDAKQKVIDELLDANLANLRGWHACDETDIAFVASLEWTSKSCFDERGVKTSVEMRYAPKIA